MDQDVVVTMFHTQICLDMLLLRLISTYYDKARSTGKVLRYFGRARNLLGNKGFGERLLRVGEMMM